VPKLQGQGLAVGFFRKPTPDRAMDRQRTHPVVSGTARRSDLTARHTLRTTLECDDVGDGLGQVQTLVFSARYSRKATKEGG
jgi:hypothetical protein